MLPLRSLSSLALQRYCREMEVDEPTAVDGNKGLKARYRFSKTSRVIELAGPIFCDVFFTERLLLSFVDLKVVLNRNRHEFCLMSSVVDAEYRVKLTEAYLKIRKVKVNPSITMAHEIAFYPIRRVECKSFIIPAGNPSLVKDNVFSGLVPKIFVFGLVESEAFNGAYKKNPYNFQHFNMSSVALSVDGEAMPFKPIQLSFGENKRFVEAFSTLFSGTRKIYCSMGNDISRD